MADYDYIEKITSTLKRNAEKELKLGNINMALELISNCSEVLYVSNIYYADEFLEKLISEVSHSLDLCVTENTSPDTILFYDGIAQDCRGLASIYLKALCQHKKVIYVSYESKKDSLSELNSILKKYGSIAVYIDDSKKNDFISQIKSLNSIINKEKPSVFFYYSFENDIVATTVLHAYSGIMHRYLINLTDHAFWLGTSCIDKCIEFRDYGASISKKYRNIGEEKLVKLPFYPNINEERKFQGYPFNALENPKFFFSGGSLYKTIGDNNRYYKLIDIILYRFEDLVFWYAGSGNDIELNKLIIKYPGRVFHTPERADLFQVLRHSCFYLSTYPICGGLMFQFAAKAGRVPVTLYYDDDVDGFLVNQEKLKVVFYDEESLLIEVGKLLNDANYHALREKQMLNAVISERDFGKALSSIINCDKKHEYKIKYNEKIDAQNFRKTYLDRLTNHDIDLILINKRSARSTLKYMPIRFFIFGVEKFLIKTNIINYISSKF